MTQDTRSYDQSLNCTGLELHAGGPYTGPTAHEEPLTIQFAYNVVVIRNDLDLALALVIHRDKDVFTPDLRLIRVTFDDDVPDPVLNGLRLATLAARLPVRHRRL